MGKSKIEWTEVTWNPVLGCSKVSKGCRNCYAMTMSSRIANAALAKQEKGKELTDVEKGYMKVTPQDEDGKFLPKWNNKIALIKSRLDDPLRWQKPRMVFVNSMSDLFHPDVPFEFVDRVFDVMADTPKHTYQILTKRPDRMAEYLSMYQTDFHPDYDFQMMYRKESYEHLGHEMPLCDEDNWPLKNVWLGTSVEDQEAADERIPHLLKCPAAVRFLSCEPLLGSVELTTLDAEMAGDPDWFFINALTGEHNDMGRPCREVPKLHWVIVGGESGHNARPMHPDWARSLRDQCQNAGVAFFFKQWGAWKEGSDKNAIEDRIILNTGAEYGVGDINSNELPKERADKWNAANPTRVSKVGKKESGRLLDDEEWSQIPQTSNH